MALTPSTMLALGTPAPAFALPDTEGRIWQLADCAASPLLLVIFLCNHCPYVKHIRERLAALTRELEAQGLATLGINANDAEKYPADSQENMARERAAVGYSFPYLFDESQETAKAFQAACTPEFYLFDSARKLIYRGEFDGSRPGNTVAVTGDKLRRAVEWGLRNQVVPGAEQIASVGCNIKWKPGNEPAYFQR